jgi:hypothetical protein
VPTAEQVTAARTAVLQMRSGQDQKTDEIRFDAAQLAAISALASDGFRPDRLLITARGKTLKIVGSHKLAFGRWLNLAVVSHGKHKGFPAVKLTAGSLSFSDEASRRILELARRAANFRNAGIPPLDMLIKRFEIDQGTVSAVVALPGESTLLSRLGAGEARDQAAAVAHAYCRLTELQKIDPSTEMAFQVRRAFPSDAVSEASVRSNRAALIALAMLIVDPEAGELAGLSVDDVKSCRIEPVDALLLGRADLPKHWLLSAALAVSTGTQFSQSIGEWKELADGISRISTLAPGDPSGFSILDLAADRSGILNAEAATTDASAANTAARLSQSGQSDLLPPPLMKLGDGMSNQAFKKAYGDIDDPRFLAMTQRIDAEIRRSMTSWTGQPH